MKICVAQINTTVGDIPGNTAIILERIAAAKRLRADLVVFPELTITGYPPRDLLHTPSFVDANLAALDRIAHAAIGIGVVVGFVGRNTARTGRPVHNSAALLADGTIRHTQHKTLLPTYDVFDEARYFAPARTHDVVKFRGVRIGLSICEDCWYPYEFVEGRRLYAINPMAKLKAAGAQLVVSLSASPFTVGKAAIRTELLARAAMEFNYPIVYANLVGGNDDLVFDGRSVAMNARGRIVREGKLFADDLFAVTLDALRNSTPRRAREPAAIAQVHDALVLGLKDYMAKCGFREVVIGLSGGIDSAVVAALAVAALGPHAVRGYSMPSPYSSEGSRRDAAAVAANLNIPCESLPIDAIYAVYRKALRSEASHIPDLADENLQARIRGTLLMTMSNRTGAIVLSTGNKSELAVGYCTLYGDMVGGLALISDVPKTMVYALAAWINRDREIIPRAIFTKPPSAELRPNQTDQDTLPPYDVLDAILKAYVEEQHSIDEIVAAGFARPLVEAIIGRVNRNEYKRRQAAPGIKVTSTAFGLGRRFPIAARIVL